MLYSNKAKSVLLPCRNENLRYNGLEYFIMEGD
nr:MAG TPA: hypothetical protein [Caudoviricetes sp.]